MKEYLGIDQFTYDCTWIALAFLVLFFTTYHILSYLLKYDKSQKKQELRQEAISFAKWLETRYFPTLSLKSQNKWIAFGLNHKLSYNIVDLYNKYLKETK